MVTKATGLPRGRPKGSRNGARDAFIHRLVSDAMADLDLTKTAAAFVASALLRGDVEQLRTALLREDRESVRSAIVSANLKPLRSGVYVDISAGKYDEELPRAVAVEIATSPACDTWRPLDEDDPERGMEFVVRLTAWWDTWLYSVAPYMTGHDPSHPVFLSSGRVLEIYSDLQPQPRRLTCDACGHVNVDNVARGERIDGYSKCRACGRHVHNPEIREDSERPIKSTPRIRWEQG